MSYQSQFQYAQKYTRIKLSNYACYQQRALTATNRYINQNQMQEVVLYGQTDPALSLDLSYQQLDGFNVQTSAQLTPAGIPVDGSDIGGLRLVCQEGGIYKIDVQIKCTAPTLLANQALVRLVNNFGFSNIAPVYANPADGLLFMHPQTSTLTTQHNTSQFRMNSMARLNQGDSVQVCYASPNGTGGSLITTIETMTIHLVKINS